MYVAVWISRSDARILTVVMTILRPLDFKYSSTVIADYSKSIIPDRPDRPNWCKNRCIVINTELIWQTRLFYTFGVHFLLLVLFLPVCLLLISLLLIHSLFYVYNFDLSHRSITIVRPLSLFYDFSLLLLFIMMT